MQSNPSLSARARQVAQEVQIPGVVWVVGLLLAGYFLPSIAPGSETASAVAAGLLAIGLALAKLYQVDVHEVAVFLDNVTDAEAGVLHRYAVKATGLESTGAVDIDDGIGLPPRYLGRF